MPYLRHTSPADSPAACSFSTLMICSSVNLLLRMSVSRRNGLYLKSRAFKGSRSPLACLRQTRLAFAADLIGQGLLLPLRVAEDDWAELARMAAIHADDLFRMRSACSNKS